MLPIAILTATYNHCKELKRLYETLKKQNDIMFSWVIVNDGSGEDTRQAIEEFIKEGILDIKVMHQKNAGKSSAINKGISTIKESVKFFVIIDDDEVLYHNAVSEMKKYYYRYQNDSCGVIHFNRRNERGEIIASPYMRNDYFMSYQCHKGKGWHADGYIGYYTQYLGNSRFEIHEGEKYIPPSALFMRVTEHSRLLWASAIIGQTEYLEGGITKQGRRLRINNPLGMIDYCRLMQGNGATLKIRVVYSIHAYAYLFFAEPKNVDMSGFISVMRIPGWVLGYVWKMLYLKK